MMVSKKESEFLDNSIIVNDNNGKISIEHIIFCFFLMPVVSVLLIITPYNAPVNFILGTIKGQKGYLILAIFAISILFFIFKIPSLKYDGIFFLLLLKSFHFFLIVLITGQYGYITHIQGALEMLLTAIIPPYIYICFSNFKVLNLKKILVFVLVFISIVLSIQIIVNTIFLVFFNGVSILHIKDAWVSALGRSNALASYILLCYFGIYKIASFRFKNCIFFLLVLSLLLTFSRGGLATFIIIILFDKIFLKKLAINAQERIHKTIIIPLLVFILLILVIPDSVKNDAVSLLTGSLYNNNSLNKISTGRIDIYIRSWNLFLNSPIYGYGIEKSLVDTGYAHNWVLEALLQQGLVGTILFICTLAVMFKKISGFFTKDRVVFSCTISLAAIILHGMVEPNLFSLGIDTIYWFIAGTCMAYVKQVYGESKILGEGVGLK